jgi:3-hydroxyisobutyrate dehydrogenase-like beta-hydroxyacid dehydrogenase
MLKAIGKVFHIGERPGMGQTMKLCNNLLSATAVAATSEVVVFGVKAGLDPTIMIDVINSGSGRNTATQDKFPKSILPRSFDFGFAMGLMYKDVKLCLEEAEAAGVQMKIASAVRELWRLGNDELGADRDFTEVIRVLESRAGVEVKGGGSRG